MRIAIYGTGGLGGYFGGRLAVSGEDVVFIARGAHLQALRDRGLHVESIHGDFTVRPVSVTDDPRTVGPCDVVLVTVKGWQLPQILASLAALIGPHTVVVPLLNGVEAPSQLAESIGEAHTAAGVAKIISFVDGPGRIRHVGADPQIAVGELDNRPSERLQRLCAALLRAGVNAEVAADIHTALWEKFLFVAGWGGVGAVTRAAVGVVRKLPETRRMLVGAKQEIHDLARAFGIALAADTVERSMAFLDSLVPEGTTSLQRDIVAGRPSELESWNGAVVRLAAPRGVTVPVNEFIYASLLPQERAARAVTAAASAERE